MRIIELGSGILVLPILHQLVSLGDKFVEVGLFDYIPDFRREVSSRTWVPLYQVVVKLRCVFQPLSVLLAFDHKRQDFTRVPRVLAVSLEKVRFPIGPAIEPRVDSLCCGNQPVVLFQSGRGRESSVRLARLEPNKGASAGWPRTQCSIHVNFSVEVLPQRRTRPRQSQQQRRPAGPHRRLRSTRRFHRRPVLVRTSGRPRYPSPC